MDHRISKDMISSGMIPSGEKNQEDLSRTQYGTAPSPNALADVYKKIYEKKEETLNEHHQKDKDGNTIPHEDEEIKEDFGISAILGTAAAKAAAAGATKAAATKAVGSTVAKGGIKQTMTRAGIKVGGKTGGQMVKTAIEKPLQTAANVSYASNMMPQTSSGKDGTKKTSSISASADLFDIVKGQLLDEGLTEEEIRDIMLTLTPDEIMSEMAVNPNIAAMDAKNKADMIARAQANKVPDKVREASKKQMKAGTPREDKNNPYTTQDKKTIIDYNKNK